MNWKTLVAAMAALLPATAWGQSREPVVRYLPPTEEPVAVESVVTASTTMRVTAPDSAAQQPPASQSQPQPANSQPRLFSPEQIPPGVVMPASPPLLTLAELEGLALANNPTLFQAAARVRAARANWVQVGLYPNPTVGYQGVEIGDEGRAGQQGIFLGQEFVLGGKLKLDRNAASQAVRQAEQELNAQRLRVLSDVRTAYYNTLIAQRRMEIAGQLETIGQQGFDTADKLLKAQEITRADLLQSRIELNTARITAANARNAYQAARRKLAAVIGVPHLEPTPLTGDLEAGICNVTWDEALGALLAGSPELAAARARVSQARWELRREQAEPIPNVDTQFTLQHDNISGDEIVGVQAVLPVPVFNRNQGGIGRAEAEVAIARGNVQRLELALQQRLAAAYQRYANAKVQVEKYSGDILPDAKASLDLAASGYRQGEFSYLMLLTAQRTYFQTNMAYLESLRELRESSIAMEFLLLGNSLGADELAPSATMPVDNNPSPVIPGMGRG